MDSRTLIKKVIEFDDAQRIGFGFSKGYPNDFVRCAPAKREDFDYEWHKPEEFSSEYSELKDFNGYLRKDEFGNLWGKMINDPSPQGEVLFGVLKEWSYLDDYKFPNLSDPKRFQYMEEVLAKSPDKFRIGTLPGFSFAIMRYMRKMELFLADLILEREYVLRLKEMVEEELIKIIDNFAGLGFDAIFFAEDWGTQDRLLISPALWREVFKPSFYRLCRHAHSKGMYVFMHSCGCIYEILEDLMEVGINVFQLDQPTLMGIDRMSEVFYKRAALFSPVDIQTILPTGNRTLIEESVTAMVEKFGSRGGGLIAKDYGDYATIQVKDEWACWMREYFMKMGNWKA